MRLFDWLFKGPVERTVDSVPRAKHHPNDRYGVELTQARILDKLSRYDAEHVVWTGANLDVPKFEYRDLSDVWADERRAAERGRGNRENGTKG